MSEPETGATPTSQPVPAGRPMPPEGALFGAALRVLTPRGFVTEALIGLNVLVYAAMVLRGVHPLEPTVANLQAWGANYGPLTTNGQWWRLFTSMFLHIGAIHIAMNMYGLWAVGRFVERIFGNLGFLVLYVVSGLVGSLASVWWHPYVTSAGASGALMGIFAALLGFMVRERDSIPRPVLDSLWRSAFSVIGINVLIGLRFQGIDQAAHLGGAAAGFLGGLALAHPLTLKAASRRSVRSLALAALAGIGLVVATRFVPRPFDVDAELAHVDDLQATFKRILDEGHAHATSDAELAKEIELDVLAPWHASRARLDAARGLPEPYAEYVPRVVGYMGAREEAFRLLVAAARTNDKAVEKQADEKFDEANRLYDELKAKK